ARPLPEVTLYTGPGKFWVAQAVPLGARQQGDWAGELRTGAVELTVLPPEPPGGGGGKPAQPAPNDPLALLPKSEAVRARVTWRKAVGDEQLRLVCFPGGRDLVAQVAEANLGALKVTTYRSVHDWAAQASQTRELSAAQARSLRGLIAALPAPAKKAP